jgi:hypothetical protein
MWNVSKSINVPNYSWDAYLSKHIVINCISLIFTIWYQKPTVLHFFWGTLYSGRWPHNKFVNPQFQRHAWAENGSTNPSTPTVKINIVSILQEDGTLATRIVLPYTLQTSVDFRYESITKVEWAPGHWSTDAGLPAGFQVKVLYDRSERYAWVRHGGNTSMG